MHVLKKIPLMLGLAVPSLSLSPVLAQEKSPSANKGESRSAVAADKASDRGAAKGGARLSAEDRNFILKAAQAGLAEVEAGKLAASQASDAGVKQFGEKLVQDHGKAHDELMQLARARGVTPPATTDASHQALAKRLQGIKGAEFDRLFISEVGVKDHDSAIRLFESQARRGQDAELKAFAEKTLPALQEHRRMAGELGGGRAGDKGAGKSAGAAGKK